MEVKYKYGHRPGRRRRTRVAIVLIVTFAIVGAIGSLIYMDIKRSNKDTYVEGQKRTVVQSVDAVQSSLRIDEPTFTMQLPGDWKLLSRVSNSTENSLTWQATKKNEDNRKLTLYVDVIPTTLPVNKLMPVTAVGDTLQPGDISDNCITYTQKSAGATGQGDNWNLAKFKQIDFHCDFSLVILNKTGTGSPDGINTVNVTGPNKGKHKYFFVFNDQNIQPNITIFTDAIKSFRAK